MDCSLPGSSVHGILQARILEWVAISSSRGSFPPRDQTRLSCISCTTGEFFATEPLGKPQFPRGLKFLQKNSKILLCKFLDEEPGPYFNLICIVVSWLLLSSSCILFLPCLATVWGLELRETQGGWMKAISNKQETVDMERICPREGSSGSCLISSPLWLGMYASFSRLHWNPAAAAAAAKSLQSCPTLCDPIDGSPLGSPVPGILQARTLEWVVISFSNAWNWKVKVKLLSGPLANEKQAWAGVALALRKAKVREDKGLFRMFMGLQIEPCESHQGSTVRGRG